MGEPELDWPVEWQPVVGSEDGLRSRLETRALRTLLWIAARLPEPVLELVVGGLARLAKALDRRRNAAARTFLRSALGEMPAAELEARVLQAYRHFFTTVVEPTRFRQRHGGDVMGRTRIVWTDDARRIAESDEGCILITPHLGNWELTLSICVALGFRPLYAVGKPPRNRSLSEFIQAEREREGVRLLPRRGAMADAQRVIRAGGTVGLLLDQRARKRPVLAPFFGRPARCDRSAGVLMRRLRAPALVLGMTRRDEPLTYELEFHDCISPEELASATPEEISTRLNRTFERMILAHPEQYLWLHDRFKDTPERFEDVEREHELEPRPRRETHEATEA